MTLFSCCTLVSRDFTVTDVLAHPASLIVVLVDILMPSQGFRQCSRLQGATTLLQLVYHIYRLVQIRTSCILASEGYFQGH